MSVPVTILAHDVGGPGGMERQLEELVRGLCARNHQVTVIARTCELPRSVGHQFVRVRAPRRPFVLAYPLFAIAVALRRRRISGLLHVVGAIAPFQADVVAVHLCHHGFRRVTSLLRVSRPTRAHRFNAWTAAGIARAGETLAFRPTRARAVVAVSDGVAREIRSAFPALANRVSVIHNGVDCNQFRVPRTRSEAAPLTAIFVGSEWEGKGLPLVLEALVLAPGWHLMVVGRGDERGMRILARELEVEERVEFRGLRHDMPAEYARADAFVLPSIYETFSLVTYEAAAAGLPLVVTRVSGIEDLVVDGENGFFTERDPAIIANHLNALADAPGLRRRLGDRARTDVAKFTWDRMIDRHVQLYSTLASR